jgi:hypothetical protein
MTHIEDVSEEEVQRRMDAMMSRDQSGGGPMGPTSRHPEQDPR